jgi:Domain of unknown function (DUF4326)
VSPKRIQMTRQRPWRADNPDAVIVARPSKWGNPFAYRTRRGLARVPAVDGSPWEYEGRISAAGMQHDCMHADGTWTYHTIRYLSRAECVELYRRALLDPADRLHLWLAPHDGGVTVEDVRRELAGKDLACWCPIDDGEGGRVPCHADVLLELSAVSE